MNILNTLLTNKIRNYLVLDRRSVFESRMGVYAVDLSRHCSDDVLLWPHCFAGVVSYRCQLCFFLTNWHTTCRYGLGLLFQFLLFSMITSWLCLLLISTSSHGIFGRYDGIVPTHLGSLAWFDSESKWAWPNLTQAQLDSFWPNLTLLSLSQNGPGPTWLLLAQFDPTLCFFLAVQLVWLCQGVNSSSTFWLFQGVNNRRPSWPILTLLFAFFAVHCWFDSVRG